MLRNLVYNTCAFCERYHFRQYPEGDGVTRVDKALEKQTKSKEFQAFDELAAKLLAVPKKEVDEKEKEYKRERRKKKAKSKKTHVAEA